MLCDIDYMDFTYENATEVIVVDRLQEGVDKNEIGAATREVKQGGKTIRYVANYPFLTVQEILAKAPLVKTAADAAQREAARVSGDHAREAVETFRDNRAKSVAKELRAVIAWMKNEKFAPPEARERMEVLIRGLLVEEPVDRSALEALIDRVGLSEDVALPGFVANPYAYMRRASLYVLSSRWEGLPTVLVEALYCGPPVIATDCPSGPGEILANGRHGVLVPVGDAPAMARASKVLPVPGAPTRRTPLGIRPPRRVNFLGSFKNAIISSSSCFASSTPATSLKVIRCWFSVSSFARLFPKDMALPPPICICRMKNTHTPINKNMGNH